MMYLMSSGSTFTRDLASDRSDLGGVSWNEEQMVKTTWTRWKGKYYKCWKTWGPLLDPNKFKQALKIGPKSIEFTQLVSWFAQELKSFLDIEETVNPITSVDDVSTFLLELSFLLKELGCTNQRLTTGNVNQRLSNDFDKLVLLELLLTELMASKIARVKYPPTVDQQLEITINSSNTAKDLKTIATTLQCPEMTSDITAIKLFQNLENAIRNSLKRTPNELLGKPLFIGELSPSQWEKLNQIQMEMHKEYCLRRDMLLKRLDVTIQSFLWSDKVKTQQDKLNEKYHAKRDVMSQNPNVTLADLLAARDDLAITEKTSNATVRKNTRSRINNVVIGNVPDRGGRAYEQEPPPPEMPPWQKDRVPQPPSQRGGRGFGPRGGRGGPGGFRDNKNATNNFGQNATYQQPEPGYYSNNRGGGYQSNNRNMGNPGGAYQYDQQQADGRDGYQRQEGRGGGRVQGGWNQDGSGYRRGGGGGGGGYNRRDRY